MFLSGTVLESVSKTDAQVQSQSLSSTVVGCLVCVRLFWEGVMCCTHCMCAACISLWCDTSDIGSLNSMGGHTVSAMHMHTHEFIVFMRIT